MKHEYVSGCGENANWAWKGNRKIEKWVRMVWGIKKMPLAFRSSISMDIMKDARKFLCFQSSWFALHDRLFHFFVRRCSKCWVTCELCAPPIFLTTFLKTLRVRKKKNQGVVRKNIIHDYWCQNPTHSDLVEIDALKNSSNKCVEKEFNNDDI